MFDLGKGDITRSSQGLDIIIFIENKIKVFYLPLLL
jgi:hypothetical protein